MSRFIRSTHIRCAAILTTTLLAQLAQAKVVKMGCGMSTEEKEGKARNEEIENQLKRDKMMQRNEIKMLLLGMTSQPYEFLFHMKC